MTILFVDGSYLIFYRYNALLNYFKLRFPDDLNPWEHPDFQTMFRRKIKECIHKLQQDHTPSYTIVALDSLLSWRKQFFTSYKQNRAHDSIISFVFQTAIQELQSLTTITLVEIDYAEADDIIHHYIRWLYDYQYPDGTCLFRLPKKQWRYCLENEINNSTIPPEVQQEIQTIIIASDKDYLPLVNPSCQLITLQEKHVVLEEGLTGDEFLQVKIIMGDKSDCIPSILPKCGIKKAISLVKNLSEFEKLLSNEEIKQRYQQNEKLIDNRHIPVEIQQQIRISFDLFIGSSNLVQKVKEG